MRQIKFRAWIEKKNENYNFSCGMHPWETIKNWVHLWEMVEEELVILEQFTGLLEKNKLELYAGDIVKIQLYPGSVNSFKPIFAEVKWADHVHGWAFYEPKYKKWDTVFTMHYDDEKTCVIEKVGNIHENGDLLK